MITQYKFLLGKANDDVRDVNFKNSDNKNYNIRKDTTLDIIQHAKMLSFVFVTDETTSATNP